MLTVLAQMVFLGIMSFLPLIVSVLLALNRVPYQGVSPISSMTPEHLNTRAAELTRVLLDSYPEVTWFTMVTCILLTVSLLQAYMTETLPVSLKENCERAIYALEIPSAASEAAPQTVVRVAAIWSGAMKIIPWILRVHPSSKLFPNQKITIIHCDSLQFLLLRMLSLVFHFAIRQTQDTS